MQTRAYVPLRQDRRVEEYPLRGADFPFPKRPRLLFAEIIQKKFY